MPKTRPYRDKLVGARLVRLSTAKVSLFHPAFALRRNGSGQGQTFRALVSAIELDGIIRAPTEQGILPLSEKRDVECEQLILRSPDRKAPGEHVENQKGAALNQAQMLLTVQLNYNPT